MARKRRKANLLSVLVYADEPQILALRSGKAWVIGLAVPDIDDAARFIATTVSDRDWESYFAGSLDLRYLFVYPKGTQRYSFDLKDIRDGQIMMEPFEEDIPEKFLPEPRFFADYHTEEFAPRPLAHDQETLLVDGSWNMPEFGKFYQKYSDVYAFLVSLIKWQGAATPEVGKRRIEQAFASKPFQGGSSYRHFFADLTDNLERNERLNLKEIRYASPGHVDVIGREDGFDDVREIIEWYIKEHVNIDAKSSSLRTFLSKFGYLKMPGTRFKEGDINKGKIFLDARRLNEAMKGPNFDDIFRLSRENTLVSAKIVLAFYRRVSTAAQFFAQGRVSFSAD